MIEIPFHGGPRDGEKARLSDAVFAGVLHQGGAYIAHLRSDWVDGEDDHLPVNERMRAYYVYASRPNPRFKFIRVASIQRIVEDAERC